MSKANETMLARVLTFATVNGVAVKPNDLISAPQKLIDQLSKDTVVDSSNEAVAYCREQKQKAIDLVEAAATVEQPEAGKE